MVLWRATARGVTPDTKVGSATLKTIVRKNLILRLAVPRFFVQGDEVVISAIVHNYLATAKTARVSFDATGLEILEGAKEIQIPSRGEAKVDWRVRARGFYVWRPVSSPPSSAPGSASLGSSHSHSPAAARSRLRCRTRAAFCLRALAALACFCCRAAAACRFLKSVRMVQTWVSGLVYGWPQVPHVRLACGLTRVLPGGRLRSMRVTQVCVSGLV